MLTATWPRCAQAGLVGKDLHKLELESRTLTARN